MTSHLVVASQLIPASVQQVYAIIADYNQGHPHILPKPHFVSLTVEKGGVGAGTEIQFQMRLMGQVRTFRAAVTEPEPGRVLVETDLDTGAATTFTVDPRDDGRHSYVTIATEIKARPGILGKLERWLASRLLHPIYVKELQQLAFVAMQQTR
ncbi:MAG: SRPBCC family protein [Anaerolineae bacterium]|nr:SRPBCC family protein [Anaerolineae bacterium]